MDNEYEKIVYNTTGEQKKTNWNIAIGLQKVDDLTPSKYLKQLAQDNCDGKISNKQVENMLYEHYQNDKIEDIESRTRECDIVSNRIVELLDMDGLSFSPAALKSIHKYLFHDIYEAAGQFRVDNIRKKEDILNGATVNYANYFSIEETLAYDFEIEGSKTYNLDDMDEVVKRITKFTSSIWQVHPFYEGNTRTMAVFIERYLNSIGFNINNTLFENNAKYFRNALVRSNYADYSRGIQNTDTYLLRFFDNLLAKGNHQLQNRELYIPENFIER